VQPTNGQAVDVRGPVDHKLTAEIEGFRRTLGELIYAEILRRAGHSANARTIPNAERQKQTIEKMQAAARGFERLRNLAEMAGDTQLFAVAERFKIASVTELPNLAALKQLVEELESIANQQVA
jgi:predicted exporter